MLCAPNKLFYDAGPGRVIVFISDIITRVKLYKAMVHLVSLALRIHEDAIHQKIYNSRIKYTKDKSLFCTLIPQTNIPLYT